MAETTEAAPAAAPETQAPAEPEEIQLPGSRREWERELKGDGKGRHQRRRQRLMGGGGALPKLSGDASSDTRVLHETMLALVKRVDGQNTRIKELEEELQAGRDEMDALRYRLVDMVKVWGEAETFGVDRTVHEVDNAREEVNCLRQRVSASLKALNNQVPQLSPGNVMEPCLQTDVATFGDVHELRQRVARAIKDMKQLVDDERERTRDEIHELRRRTYEAFCDMRGKGAVPALAAAPAGGAAAPATAAPAAGGEEAPAQAAPAQAPASGADTAEEADEPPRPRRDNLMFTRGGREGRGEEGGAGRPSGSRRGRRGKRWARERHQPSIDVDSINADVETTRDELHELRRRVADAFVEVHRQISAMAVEEPQEKMIRRQLYLKDQPVLPQVDDDGEEIVEDLEEEPQEDGPVIEVDDVVVSRRRRRANPAAPSLLEEVESTRDEVQELRSRLGPLMREMRTKVATMAGADAEVLPEAGEGGELEATKAELHCLRERLRATLGVPRPRAPPGIRLESMEDSIEAVGDELQAIRERVAQAFVAMRCRVAEVEKKCGIEPVDYEASEGCELPPVPGADGGCTTGTPERRGPPMETPRSQYLNQRLAQQEADLQRLGEQIQGAGISKKGGSIDEKMDKINEAILTSFQDLRSRIDALQREVRASSTNLPPRPDLPMLAASGGSPQYRGTSSPRQSPPVLNVKGGRSGVVTITPGGFRAQGTAKGKY